ncbi:MAG: c-type cytochrome [Methyloligellaceae bacterium]
MDSIELNKYAGAILAALLVLFGTKTIVDISFKKHPPAKPGYNVEVASTGDSGAKTDEKKDKVEPLGVRLAKADVAKGESQAKKCKACHTFNSGGKNGTGPNLYNIVNRKVAAVDGFAYSKSLTEKGGDWEYGFLECFIKNPKKCLPGTKMAFAGVKKPGQRADLILYLRSLAETPAELPAAN